MPAKESKAVAIATPGLTRERRELIKRTFAQGATDDEFALFVTISERTGLSIEARQIFMVKRWDSRLRREVMQVQTSIDGFRLIADRSGKYEGQVGPLWCGMEGLWRDVWTDNEPPVAARVGVLKAGCREPFWSVARYSEYVQTDKEGRVVSMWRKMPANQLAKCAEALSLRKAFPQEMSGLYTGDELPPPEPEPETEIPRPRPWTSFKGMLHEFADCKARLGPENESFYYAVLEEYGVKHANEFRDSGQAIAAYDRLQTVVEEREAANFSPAQPETKAE